MIGFLRGQVLRTEGEQVLLDVGGVGYELSCSSSTTEALLPGDGAQLWVHTHVREDALQLYGFATALEKRMFLSLLDVHGIGPKLAIKILSASTLAHLVEMIEAGDVRGLSGLPKVGKKTAEQLILALKGKLVLNEVAAPSATKPARVGAVQGVRAEIMSALVNLGFRLQDVERTVVALPEDIELQQGLRQSLQSLAGPL